MKPHLLFLTIAFVTAVGLAVPPDPVFDLPALLATPLDAKVLQSTEKDGIITEEVMFHSERDGANRVDIFAFFSYPKGAEKLPAFIWNQGGLGQASTYWTEFGAKRGYATLCIDFPMPGYRSTGGYPIVSGLEVGTDPKKAPIYHGAVALLKAVSFLESRKEVDKDRLGMAGSSWGGFYTTLMAGLDPRLKACSAMFGTGNLQLGNSWWDSGGKSAQHDAAARERWRSTLDPASRLGRSKAAIAWFTGSNDFAYWMPAVMATYAKSGATKHLTVLPNWNHGLTPIIDEQVFAWLDVHLKGGPPFNQVGPLVVFKPMGVPAAMWESSGPREVKSAELILSYGDEGNWTSRYWIRLEAKREGGRYKVTLPHSSIPYYIGGAITDTQGFRYSTPILKIDPAKLAMTQDPVAPDYDGCSEWGGFEPDHVTFLKAHALMNPTTSADAKEGTQSCVLKGKTEARYIQFTAGLPHRFSCFLKADKEVEVKLALTGSFDGKQQMEERSFNIGKDWTPVTMDYLPPKCVVGTLSAVFTVPEGTTALLDCVEFRPKK